MMADEKKVTRLLKTARGQLDGILKMVEENRYCIDISQQIMATEAILNRVNKEILTAHLKHCVQEAKTDEERAQKDVYKRQVVMLLVRGIPQVLGMELSRGMDAAVSGIAGIGHILTGAGLVLFFLALRRAAPGRD